MGNRVAHSLSEQALALRERFPDSKIALRPTSLVWTGTIQPSTLSCEYTIRITYSTGYEFPRVHVIAPRIDPRPGEALPHVYQGDVLCLHKKGEWTPDMLIADTTIAWTSEWLIHYEIWRATGNWYGGGEPISPGSSVDGSGSSLKSREGPHRQDREWYAGRWWLRKLVR